MFFFAVPIAENFFPEHTQPLVNMINAFAIFFIGYLARPFGALFFGRIGDNFGRKPALITSISLMAISTFFLGLLPNYQDIGVWAPILLMLLRLLQGFSVGGELTGSIIFMLEHAPKNQRGFYGSLVGAGTELGVLLASFFVWLVHYSLSTAAITQWAWRLPFVLGIIGGLVGWFARRSVPETQLFREVTRMPDSFLTYYREYIKYIRHSIVIIGILLFGTVLMYLVYAFSVTYMSNMLSYTSRQALGINIVSLIFLFLLEPFMGKLSDYIGRRPVMVLAIIGSILFIWPYFWLLQQHDVMMALAGKLVMTLFAAAYFAVAVVTMVEIVPVQMRFGIVAFAYAVAASIFGGVTPLIATLLIKLTHSLTSPAYYLVASGLISLIAIYKVRETRYRLS